MSNVEVKIVGAMKKSNLDLSIHVWLVVVLLLFLIMVLGICWWGRWSLNLLTLLNAVVPRRTEVKSDSKTSAQCVCVCIFCPPHMQRTSRSNTPRSALPACRLARVLGRVH